MEQNNSDPLFEKPAACRYLNLSLSTLNKLTAGGEILSIKTGDAPSCKVMFRQSALDSFLKSRERSVIKDITVEFQRAAAK